MKKLQEYKGFTINQISERDDKDINTYEFYVCLPDGDIKWESNSYQECIDWIDCYIEDGSDEMFMLYLIMKSDI